MISILYAVVAWAASGLIARLLLGAGLTLVVYAGVVTGVTALLDSSASALGGLPSDMINLILLSGLGEAMSIIGSAILSKVALSMAGNVAGFKRT
jgi:hypothetical protein